jgi:hypothetical protein
LTGRGRAGGGARLAFFLVAAIADNPLGRPLQLDNLLSSDSSKPLGDQHKADRRHDAQENGAQGRILKEDSVIGRGIGCNLVLEAGYDDVSLKKCNEKQHDSDYRSTRSERN